MKGKTLGDYFPEVDKALYSLRQSCANAGPLDARVQLLVRLAVAAALGFEPAICAEASRATQLGVSLAEMQQVILLVIPNAGYVRAAEALTWLNQAFGKEPIT